MQELSVKFKISDFYYICSPGMLAQLVQSTALTGRGSLVRAQYIPLLRFIYSHFYSIYRTTENKKLLHI